MLSSLDSSLRWKRVFMCSAWPLIIFSKQAMGAHTKRTAGNFHGKDFVLLDVVIDSTAINIDYPGCTNDSHHFHIFLTTWTPDFVSQNDRGSLFFHGHDGFKAITSPVLLLGPNRR